jgi:MiaB/RimO family radical SAM methylthiotransferase
LVAKLKSLVESGATEVQLCAQDTGVYGADIGMDLAGLVGALETVDGDFMLRIGMMNPANLVGNIPKALKAFESQKVFKFLHLPVQSGSDAILKKMRRNHRAEDFRNIVNVFRERFPGMAISTDMIIGFPGETDADFQMSMDLMRETKPDIINVTRFSARPGTEAHGMRDKVPGWKAKDRSREMSALRFSLTSENYGEMKSDTTKALATERRIEGTTFLRTVNYRPVVVKGEVELGRWYNVKITGKAKTHLNGKLENPQLQEG